MVAAEIGVVLEQLHAARPAARVLVHAVLPRGGDVGDFRDRGAFHRSAWWTAAANSHFGPVGGVTAG